MFKGNGESRKYVGSYTGPPEKGCQFFQYSDWGKRQIDGKEFILLFSKCFFSKNNLLRYLHDSKIEYQKQEQVYRFDISELFSNYKETINNLVEDKLFFSIYDVSDSVENKQSRGYIRSDDKIWGIWRKIILPKISYLSILKLIPCDDIKTKTPLFFFRILLDYQFRSIVHPKSSEVIKKEVSKKKLKLVNKERVNIYIERR